MEDDKNLNRRRKSIMVIDKKGQTKELAKDDQGVSTLIENTDKTAKDRTVSPPQDMNKSINTSMDMNKSINTSVDINKSVDNAMDINKSMDKSMDMNKSVDNAMDMNKSMDMNKLNAENIADHISEDHLDKVEQDKANTEKMTLNMRNAEIAAGATAGAAAGITLGKSKEEEDKHVTIDEKKNEEHEVESDSNKAIPLTEEEKSDVKARSPTLINQADTNTDTQEDNINNTFIPQRIPSHDLLEDSEIKKERDDNNVEAEGHIWKRRRIFACFWHEKYFLLTKDGFLKYHKANGTKKSKGNWDLKLYTRIHEVFMGGESHPFRLALMNNDENLLLGFDDSDNREYWLTKLSKYINNN